MNELDFDFITILPSCISLSVLCEWIELKDLARLDSAYCKQTERKCFLDLIHFEEFISTDMLFTNPASLNWAILRDVKVVRLELDPLSNQVLLTQYLQRNEKFVRALVVCNRNYCETECRNLLELSCMLTCEELDLISINPGLQILDLELDLGLHHEENFVTEDFYISQISKIALPNLISLTISNWSDEQSFECVVALVKMSQCLQGLTLHLTVDDETCLAITQHCSKLRSLHITRADLSDDAMVELGRLCPDITRLSFSINNLVTDAGLIAMVKHLPQLRVVKVHCGENLTEECMRSIGQYCPLLEEFFVNNWSL